LNTILRRRLGRTFCVPTAFKTSSRRKPGSSGVSRALPKSEKTNL